VKDRKEEGLMITAIGKALRRIRLEKDEYLKDMADKLGVSSSYLSAIENGKRRLTSHLLEKIKKTYRLSPEQAEELDRASLETQERVYVDINGMSESKKTLAMAFARDFEGISEEQMRRIRDILEEGDDK